MLNLGTPELLIILVIIILLFGVGRIGKIAGELGKGVSAFRAGLADKKTDEDAKKEAETTDKKEDKAEKE